MHFLYLHGANSSPRSRKCQQLAAFIQTAYPKASWYAPQLGLDISETLADLQAYIESCVGPKLIFGSSLGGLLAHHLCETRQDITAAILINPALRPDLVLPYLPRQQYHPFLQQHYHVTDDMIADINRLMAFPVANSQKYLLLLQKDDRLTPGKLSAAAIPQANIVWFEDGQGHGFEEIGVAFSTITQHLKSLLPNGS